MEFPRFDHLRWLMEAHRAGPPRHDLGTSGFVADDPLEGLPDSVVAGDVAGDLEAAAAYREALARHVGVPADGVLPTAGTSAANLAVIARHVRPGATVVCERPYYAQLPLIAQGLGARLRFVDRGPDGRLDPHHVDAALDDMTRLVLLTSPNNPTGHALDADALRHLGEAAAAVGAQVLVDQVFAELTGHASAAGLHPALLSTAAFTKCWGAPGLRAGWVAGDADAVASVAEVHHLLVSAPAAAGMRLAHALLGQKERRRARLAARLRANHALFRQWAAQREPGPHGDLFAFLPVEDSLAAAQRLRSQGILTVPGEHFGRPGAVRIGLGVRTDDLREGLAALDAALGTPPAGAPSGGRRSGVQ